MLNNPTQLHKKDSDHPPHFRSEKNSTQHGKFGTQSLHKIAFLLAIPSESLTHITSFLDPPSLFMLARVNKQLHDHIGDDNTWHRAFLCQFLNIGPEGDIDTTPVIMLRRTESSWKKEFVLRFNLRLRWEKSRSTTVTHSPLNSEIGSIYLMSENVLLTSSIQYGIVARSHPLTGKIFRGYLDAAGTSNGLGTGNPNAEFSPNVTTCTFISEGQTAKILWGFRNGEVAVTFANRVMDISRTGGAKLIRCHIEDEHDGMVVDAVWGAGGNVFVSASVDGRIKLWDGKRVRCLWTSEIEEAQLVSSPCSKVAFDAERGIVAAALLNGEIFVWFGLTSLCADDGRSGSNASNAFQKIVIPATLIRKGESEGPSHDLETLTIIHPQSSARVSLVTKRSNEWFFNRIDIDILSRAVIEIFQFGEECGIVTSIQPFVTRHTGESSFVLVGDRLGCLSVYDWNASSRGSTKSAAIPPFRRLEAFGDGSSITSIEWNPTIMVTGSSSGSIRVWDSLTFTHLRSFTPPGSKPRGGEWESVRQIVLEREVMVVVVGAKVMTWKAGPVGRSGKLIVRSSKKGKSNDLAKWRQQLELYREIADSQKDLEQEKNIRRQVYNRERDQIGSLDALGLNEREALEYVLMLSREEEDERREKSGTPPVSVEHGLFQGDFDIISRSPSSSPPALFPLPSTGLFSNSKVQVGPRVQPEPMTAGTSSSSHPRAIPIQVSASLSSIDNFGIEGSFPKFSSSLSSTSASGTPGASNQGSPHSIKSVWGTRVKSISRPCSVSVSPRGCSESGTMGDARCGANDDVEEDRDLKFAIQLSLAEARSRGEDV